MIHGINTTVDMGHLNALANQQEVMTEQCSAPKASSVLRYASAAEECCDAPVSAAYPGHGDADCLEQAVQHAAAHALGATLAPYDGGAFLALRES